MCMETVLQLSGSTEYEQVQWVNELQDEAEVERGQGESQDTGQGGAMLSGVCMETGVLVSVLVEKDREGVGQ